VPASHVSDLQSHWPADPVDARHFGSGTAYPRSDATRVGVVRPLIAAGRRRDAACDLTLQMSAARRELQWPPMAL
jgi:hypothetical protein